MKKITLRQIVLLFLVFVLGVFCEPPVFAASEKDIYLKIENFTWEEYDDSGSMFLEESGPICGLGLLTKSDFTPSLSSRFKGELFSGSIDYDGQTQGGMAVKTDTDYFGFKIEGDIIKSIPLKKSYFEPFTGLGYRWWKRDIKSTGSVVGYEERWSSFYARLGIRGSTPFHNDKRKFFFEIGTKISIYNENEVDLSPMGLSKVTVEPGNEVSGFVEAGLQWKKFKASLFYENMNFSKSDIVVTDGIEGFQPESKAEMSGVNVGISF